MSTGVASQHTLLECVVWLVILWDIVPIFPHGFGQAEVITITSAALAFATFSCTSSGLCLCLQWSIRLVQSFLWVCSKQVLWPCLSLRQRMVGSGRRGNLIDNWASGQRPTFKSNLYCFFHVPGGSWVRQGLFSSHMKFIIITRIVLDTLGAVWGRIAVIRAIPTAC